MNVIINIFSIFNCQLQLKKLNTEYNNSRVDIESWSIYNISYGLIFISEVS